MKQVYCCTDVAYDSDNILHLTQSLLNFGVREDSAQAASDIKKTSSAFVISYGCVEEELKRFKNICLDINKNVFGFDLYEKTEFDGILYNIYDSSNQGEYDWHNDSVIDQMFDIKLTGLLNVSTENYSGGEFLIFNGIEEEIKEFSKPGSILLFPSWVPHKVSPVSAGCRKTVTMFFTGPCLK